MSFSQTNYLKSQSFNTIDLCAISANDTLNIKCPKHFALRADGKIKSRGSF
jgi:hypothetical protein